MCTFDLCDVACKEEGRPTQRVSNSLRALWLTEGSCYNTAADVSVEL